jgi:allantoicase
MAGLFAWTSLIPKTDADQSEFREFFNRNLPGTHAFIHRQVIEYVDGARHEVSVFGTPVYEYDERGLRFVSKAHIVQEYLAPVRMPSWKRE